MYSKQQHKGKGKVHSRTGHEGPRRGLVVQLYSFINLSARWGWCWPLYPRERPGTLCIGGWVGHTAGLDSCGKPRPHRHSISGPSSPQRVAIPTELSRPGTFVLPLAEFFLFQPECSVCRVIKTRRFNAYVLIVLDVNYWKTCKKFDVWALRKDRKMLDGKCLRTYLKLFLRAAAQRIAGGIMFRFAS